jgi:hypothetical protein
LKNSKKMGRGYQYQQTIDERVGGHRQLGVQLGGASASGVGHTGEAQLGGTFESQQTTVNQNPFADFTGYDVDEVVDSSMEIDTAND